MINPKVGEPKKRKPRQAQQPVVPSETDRGRLAEVVRRQPGCD